MTDSTLTILLTLAVQSVALLLMVTAIVRRARSRARSTRREKLLWSGVVRRDTTERPVEIRLRDRKKLLAAARKY